MEQRGYCGVESDLKEVMMRRNERRCKVPDNEEKNEDPEKKVLITEEHLV